MADNNGFKRGYSTAIARWASFGPYYAMFPVEFAFSVVERYSHPGQFVLDPFAGRGVSIYAAAVQGRRALGVEITAVGWLFGQVKLTPAPKEDVLARLAEFKDLASGYAAQASEMPQFYRYCFSPSVLMFLLATRDQLAWRTNPVDMTLMAFITMYLHGKLTQGLSNQMRATKAMSPEYSVRWWTGNGYSTPPDVDWYAFLKKRIEWRYKMGLPPARDGNVWLGDSTLLLKDLVNSVARDENLRCSLLFTSPPYFQVINYFKDQWIRNWMLGGSSLPKASTEKYAKRFESQVAYRDLLETVFGDAAKVMTDDGVIYVRTDAREFTLETTKEVLAQTFPNRHMHITPVPINGQTQTTLFGDKSAKPGEIDIVMS